MGKRGYEGDDGGRVAADGRGGGGDATEEGAEVVHTIFLDTLRTFLGGLG